MHQLNICHLYPDILNLYGDRGNAIALKYRAESRNIAVEIKNVSLSDPFVPEEYDIVLIGGGQDYELEIIQRDLLVNKGAEMKNAISNGKVFLCICGGYQLLGKFYRTNEGKEVSFLGALDIWTIGGRERLIGNLVFECDFLKSSSGDNKIIGFENHSGRTYLGSGVAPLGRVLKGKGNNGEDLYEGSIYKNVYCSYSHGSILPKNPDLADHLLTLAMKQKYTGFEALEPLEDEFEKLAHNAMINKLLANVQH